MKRVALLAVTFAASAVSAARAESEWTDEVSAPGTVEVTVNAVAVAPSFEDVSVTASVSDPAIEDPLEQHRPGDQPHGYASAGAAAGGGYFDAKGFVLDGGKRIGRSAWFARALFQGGNSSLETEPGRGTYWEARGGLEVRGCAHGGMVCGSAGVDAGIHREEFTHVVLLGGRHEYVERFDSTVVAPRLTLDAGGRVRFRVAVELPFHMRGADSMAVNALARGTTPTNPQQDSQYVTNLAASFALAVGF
ncbi:MAG: hypothetical protein KF773_09625 [Deltaproteobacteria bacterium]|nr:hypothetical protein [Deltaproteobacteria bacterium]